jgi:hypothetical protein
VEKPGADGCLDDWGDNAYLSLAVLTSTETDTAIRREGKDTLVYESFKDASLQGLTLANLFKDPYSLDYTRIEMGDSADRGVDRSEMKALLSIHPLDSSRTLPRRFSLRQRLENGSTKGISLSGGGPDSAALPGETVRVRVDTTSPAPDSLASFSMTFMVSLSDFPRVMERNAMLSFSVDCGFRGSSIAQASLLFEPALPVLFGGPSKEGKLTASVKRIPSGSATLVGRYSGSRVEATYVEQPSGVSHEVVLDGGRVVSTRENGP